MSQISGAFISGGPHNEGKTYLPGSREEAEFLIQLARSVANFSRMEYGEQNALLTAFQRYECYAQISKLLDWRIHHDQSADDARLFSDYLWLIRIYYFGLERADLAIKTASDCVKKLRLSFAMVRIHIIEDIVGPQNYRDHVLFFKTLVESLPDHSQRILLYERLALIYEKKLCLDAEVEPIYAKILKLDPKNIKSLKFYKALYTQNNEWSLAAEHLELLLESSNNLLEKQRTAHELAQVYLYNLNEPQKARGILSEHCSESLLDTKQTYIEILERLGAFEELIQYLSEAEHNAKGSFERAEIRLKQGHVCLSMGKKDRSIDYFQSSIRIEPEFLSGYEALISVYIEEKNEPKIRKSLEALLPRLKNNANQKAIQESLLRLSC